MNGMYVGALLVLLLGIFGGVVVISSNGVVTDGVIKIVSATAILFYVAGIAIDMFKEGE